MRNLKISTLLVVALASANLQAQAIPKQEMRAAWVTTVWGLDWPATVIPTTGSTYHIDQQKSQMIALLDKLKSANMNTIFFQVRSECDAMYQSSYEPWSSYLVATRGMDPGYDPLQFVIEEGHKRGMEVHAWLNPYRFESVVGKYAGKAGDYRDTHPEWVLEYPDKADGSKNVAILDPGNPGVRQRITDIVEELVTNYDLDGLTFDDYFYAYGGTPLSLDAYSQNLWKPAEMNVHDWRRQNVNQMVADVYNKIQSIKPYITYGLSPFGIWTTDPAVAAARDIELPKGITGLNAYQDIYCDPVAWLEQGTVDYVSPQLYWPTTSTGQDYKVLAPWWSDISNRFRRHLYVSHSISDLASSSYAPGLESPLKSISSDTVLLDLKGLSMLEYFSQPSLVQLKGSTPPTEYGLQVQINRQSDKNGAPGSVFFRASQFYEPGFTNYLASHEYANRSIAPAINWKGVNDRALPVNLRLEGDLFKWESGEDNVRFVVYAIPNDKVNEAGNFSTGAYILGVSYRSDFDLTAFSDITVATHTMAVSVLDRFGNEFPPVLMNHAPSANEAAVLTYPADQQQAFNPFSFRWNQVEDAELYLIEVAEDAAFGEVIYRRELTANEFAAVNISMNIGTTYHWRVITRKTGVADAVSQVRQFTFVDQPRPQILQPTNNSTNVILTPTIEWAQFDEGYSYDLQIALNTTFSVPVVEVTNIAGLSYEVPQNTLMASSTYFVRVQAHDTQSTTAWSEVLRFSTVETPPSVPVIISPANGDNVAGPDITLEIMAEPLAKSFTWQLSSNPAFPILNSRQKTVNAFNYEVVYDGLTPGTWYARVRANYGVSSVTDYSTVVSFNIVATAINETDADKLMLICPTLLKGENVVVTYRIPADSKVRLFLSDLTGRLVSVLDDRFRPKGEYRVDLSSGELSKGIYFLTLQTENDRKTVKLIR